MKPSMIMTVLVLLGCLSSTRPVAAQGSPTAKIISHDVPDTGYLQLLSGPPVTVTMRSGRVILSPGKSVGKHSTGTNEEILVILEGQGEMQIAGGTTLQLNRSVVAYCPPNTEHDVLNNGTGILRYVYIVARAK
jgi:quercetin dioxygenase-like cupin family protein